MMQLKWRMKIGFYHAGSDYITTTWLYGIRKDIWYYRFLESIGEE